MSLGDKIAKMINEGLSLHEAATRLKVSRPTAYLALYKAGWRLKKIAVKQKKA